MDQRLAIAAVIVARMAPARLLDSRRTLCLFRRLTGLPCPTCGMTRSWHAAANLRLRDSVSYHPLGPPTLAAVLLIATGWWRPPGRDATTMRWWALGSLVWLATWLGRVAVERRSGDVPGVSPGR